MRNLARALVYATTYIDLVERDDDDRDQDDVGALESIAGFLAAAGDDELDSLAAAAEELLAEEVARARPRPELVESYRTFMEDLLVEGWTGNRRGTDPPR